MFNPLGIIFVYVGGAVRFLYGTIIRNLGLTTRKRYKLKEYIHGVNETGDFIFEKWGHEIINRVVGMITVVILAVLIAKYF